MKVKLKENHLKFLEKHLKKEHPKLYEDLNKNILSIVFELNDDLSIKIRDWCGDKLQLIGFDENWELNENGEIIDDLVDVFYTDKSNSNPKN